MSTLTMTKDNFEQTVEDNDIVVIDFWAEWCGPCKAFAPIFEQAAEDHKDITFAKVDTDAEQELAATFNVRSIPTLVVFRENIPLLAQPGMLPAHALGDLIQQVRDLDMDEVRADYEKHLAEQA